MPLSAAATSALEAGLVKCHYQFYLRTNFAESDEWELTPYEDFSISQLPSPSQLTVTLALKHFNHKTENNKTNRKQCFALCLLVAFVGSEYEVQMIGRVRRVDAGDFACTLLCESIEAWASETEYRGTHAPTEVEVVAEGDYRELSELADFPGTFVLTTEGVGDEGFDEATSTLRRSWIPGTARVYCQPVPAWFTGTHYELPAEHYSIDWAYGAVQILESEPGRTYFIGNLLCAKESAATGATDVDYSTVIIAALEHPAPEGMGIDAAEIDIAASNLDLSGPITFPGDGREAGYIIDLVRSFQKAHGVNQVFEYDPTTATLDLTDPDEPVLTDSGRWRYYAVTQKAPAAEDFTLRRAKAIAQPRGIDEVVTKVVATGYKTFPTNALTKSTDGGSGVVLSDNSSAGDFFRWDQANGGPNEAFATSSAYLFDGGGHLGLGLHNLAASENGGTNKWDSWYDFITLDLGTLLFGSRPRVSRIRAVLPPSNNPNQNSDQRTDKQGFWPGLWVQGSMDGTNWYTLCAALDRVRDRPGATIEITGKQITQPYARYLRIRLSAFKQGDSNQGDPAVGLMELGIFIDEEYRHVFEIQATDAGAVYTFVKPGGSSISSYYVDFCTRLGLDSGGNQRQRMRHINYEDQYSELVAYDVALQTWAEALRQMRTYRFTTAEPDPRIKPWQTVAAIDALLGNASFLVDAGLVKTPKETIVSGTDYLAPVVTNS